MSKVFLAYKKVDVARANAVRAALEALEVSLFIDQKPVSGDHYLSMINEELNSALAVLVLWTEAAVHMPGAGEMNFVLSEAQKGYARGVLVAATFEKIALDHLPVPFNVFQAPDLSDWIQTGASAKHSEWQKVLAALGKKLGRPGLPEVAIARESGDEGLKKKCLKDYPEDPYSRQFADELEAFERKEFEDRLSAAQQRVQQRSREAQKRLKSCREDFEKQLGELRAGRDFMPPDPVTAIDDNVAKLADQIEIFEDSISEQRARAEQAEASAAQANAELEMLRNELNTALANQNTEAGGDAGQSEAMQTEIESLKKRAQGEPRRLFVRSGVVAAFAACLFGFGGWLSARSGSQADPRSQILQADVTGSTARSETRFADVQRRTEELQAREAAVAAQEQTLSAQRAELEQRTASLKAQLSTFARQQTDLRTREIAFAAGREELEKQRAASKGIPLAAQCDLLAGYQFDPDRPQGNGFSQSTTDFSVAQTICQNAVAAAGEDQVTRRRLLLELGRTYRQAQPEKALQLWKQASDLGSSHAVFELARYYGDRTQPQFNATTAWENYKRSADMNPPDPGGLYFVAYNLLFRDSDNNLLPASQADPVAGEAYLRKALNADYDPAYYIAGVYYWRKGKDERNKESQAGLFSKATGYLTTSWCVKRDNSDTTYNADAFYFRQTNRHLPCQ